ncbi:hypothetical protein CLV84_4305 [Neolewinella xylanilytica]|uniref:Uncharacterized protein n=1 Tax=Neolewinella xylanilytica TaxID=1514080 RepID=A0A2S6HZR1_9BACT|nr:hypothetical protein [Neolewinella xylanilytica]PPK83932.1 hypothetical protein CLV84_4305 [Neolewinella xylanilytica]
MGFFGSSPTEKQLEIYQELLDEKRKRYESMEGGKNSPEIAMQREQLSAEMKQLEIQIEDAREREAQGREHTHGLDLLDD